MRQTIWLRADAQNSGPLTRVEPERANRFALEANPNCKGKMTEENPTTETPTHEAAPADADKTKTPEPEKVPTWKELGFGDQCLDLIEKAGYTKPTQIQVEAIPPALDGRDILASARTGSGKTAAFCLPIIERLAGRSGTFALILAPTREIAVQTHEFLEEFATPLGLTSSLVIGGIGMKITSKALKAYPQIIVGTPGRVADHLERGDLWLDYLEYVVLDEADRMLDMGFSKQLDLIIDATPTDRQTLLFSATMPKEAENLAKRILYEPARIRIGNPKNTARNVTQEIRWVNARNKQRELVRIIEEEPGTIMVFTRTKDGASELWRMIHSHGVHDSTYISSNKQQKHRMEALNGFKDGTYRVLIATDVAGRGIHVDGVAMVVNFDFPMETEDYIHRIGRTGRQDAAGKAVTLATNRDRRGVVELEKRIGEAIVKTEARGYRADEDDYVSRGGGGGGGNRGGRGGPGGGGGNRGGRGGPGGGGGNRGGRGGPGGGGGRGSGGGSSGGGGGRGSGGGSSGGGGGQSSSGPK